MMTLRFRRMMAAAAMTLTMAGCSRQAPPATTTSVEKLDPNVFSVEHPELFKLVKVESRDLPAVLDLNGSVAPDVNRTVHVTSQGAGRVVEIKARLGDFVQKGQVLLTVASADLGGATSDYHKAVADELLAHKALDRAQALYDRGALAAKDLEAAQNAEDKAKVDVTTAADHVKLLGGSLDHPNSLIALRAPVSGTIVEQNVAGNEGVKSLDNTPSLFTIADLSRVWVLCDVFENDLGQVHVGDEAEIRLNAFPDRVFHGRISDLSRVLDPNTRSAKARIELDNVGGLLRPGMFATVRFRSVKTAPQLLVPAAAVLRLQDKDWVFRQQDEKHFRKQEVHTAAAQDGLLRVTEGLAGGDALAASALEFSAAVTEKQP